MDDRNETQRYAIVSVLAEHLEERLNHVVFERILDKLIHAIREGPCSWAFQPGTILQSSENMSASEALFGFAGWMTTMKETQLVGSRHDAAFWADLVGAFLKTHGLREPRAQWEENLIYPEQLNLW